MPDLILVLVAIVTVFCAIGVIASREAVHSALFLTAHLVGVAVLFLALTHQFLAAAQVLVYAGAVMVVFMFAVTTLSPKEEPLRFFPLHPLPVMGFGAGMVMFGLLLRTFSVSQLSERLPAGGDELVPIQSFALDLFGPFLLPFEGTAFLLLVALIGAVILGGRRQRGDG